MEGTIHSGCLNVIVSGLRNYIVTYSYPYSHFQSLHRDFALPLASQTFAAASAACFSASLLISFALIQRYDGMLEHRNSTYAVRFR